MDEERGTGLSASAIDRRFRGGGQGLLLLLLARLHFAAIFNRSNHSRFGIIIFID